MAGRPRKTLRELWDALPKGAPDACWVEPPRPHSKGRLRLHVGRTPDGRRVRRDMRLNRVAFEMTHGPVPAGLFVLHSCHNPGCYNPAHLRVGTAADNVADMVNARRAPFQQPGYRWELLPDEYVREIRAARRRSPPLTAKTLCEVYGVSEGVIWDIVAGRTYRNVT